MDESFSLWEKVARQRRMRATCPTMYRFVQNRGAGSPHPALPRHPLRWERVVTAVIFFDNP
jgi:hypothetical protein